jgi:hypothetical protein
VKFVTPLLIVSGVVVGLSGVLMFWHLEPRGLKDVHELLGLVFVVVCVLHVINNIRPLKSQFARSRSLTLMSVSALVIVALWGTMWFVDSRSTKSVSGKAIIAKLQNAPLSASAPIFGLSSDEAVSKLRFNAIDARLSSQSIKQIAKSNNKTANDIITILMSPMQ